MMHIFPVIRQFWWKSTILLHLYVNIFRFCCYLWTLSFHWPKEGDVCWECSTFQRNWRHYTASKRPKLTGLSNYSIFIYSGWRRTVFTVRTWFSYGWSKCWWVGIKGIKKFTIFHTCAKFFDGFPEITIEFRSFFYGTWFFIEAWFVKWSVNPHIFTAWLSISMLQVKFFCFTPSRICRSLCNTCMLTIQIMIVPAQIQATIWWIDDWFLIDCRQIDDWLLIDCSLMVVDKCDHGFL